MRAAPSTLSGALLRAIIYPSVWFNKDMLPYNDYFEYYGPDYRLHMPTSNMENMNKKETLEEVRLYSGILYYQLKVLLPLHLGWHAYSLVWELSLLYIFSWFKAAGNKTFFVWDSANDLIAVLLH